MKHVHIGSMTCASVLLSYFVLPLVTIACVNSEPSVPFPSTPEV